MRQFKYHILLHAIIFIWGFTGILGVLISVDALSIVWYRVLIAFLSLFLFIFFTQRKFFRVVNKKNIWLILLVGVFVGAHWITFYQSIKLSTASLGILCLSTTTIHVSWLEPLLLKKPFSLSDLLLSSVVVIGIYIVSDDLSGSAFTALFIGLLSALFAAVFAVLNARLVEQESSKTITLYEMFSAFMFMTIILAFNGRITPELFILSSSDLFWLIFLGVLCTSFAFLATIDIVKHLGAFTVSLSINLEPVYTIVLAIFILEENKNLGFKFYIGAFIIIGVVLLNAYLKFLKRRKNKTFQPGKIIQE